jgi:UDP-N-acetyl-D-mannosaminuronic acid dehydrogenase
MKYNLCVIGGAGHVGLPFGVAAALAGVKTVLFDIDIKSLDKIRSGRFPFKERDGNESLAKALEMNTLFVSDSPDVISESRKVLLVVGTPVDQHLNPDFKGIFNILEKYFSYFRQGQILILRSTVYPGTSARIQQYFNERKKGVRVSFCPERIAEGEALHELKEQPQIISAFDKKTFREMKGLFERFVDNSVVVMEPIEAELAKLFSNSWRYVKFALANQFYMIAQSRGLNYHRILEGMKKDYPRNEDLPGPGFAAGPCLLKDTMQLSAFTDNTFFMGHSAMLINENFPKFVIEEIKRKLKGKLGGKTLGILGMAFKAESDDRRDSLSFKLKKIAETEFNKVLCHDFYVKDKSFSKLKDLISESDVVVLAAPHKKYSVVNPKKYKNKIFIDVWNFWGQEVK